MKKLAFPILLILVISLAVFSQSPFKGCKAEGLGKKTDKNPTGKISEHTKEQNRLKNRDDGPTAGQIDTSITLAELLRKANDKKFTADQGVTITGFVAEVSPGGKAESCNCSRDDLQDIHIALVAKESQASNNNNHFVVEITPKFQADLGGYKVVKKALEGKWVKFTGWLFYDDIHKQNAVNNNGKGNLWRKTIWEVHPVSAYEVVDAP